jgi:hypothetical protein
MIVNDRLYGKKQIIEPLAIEIIKSKSFQRLKKISQAGYFKPHFPQAKMNRYDHSVGVYLLLKKVGATREEQISGLLHDVSHAVFSHCIDYVLPGGSGSAQDYQDNFLKQYIKQTELAEIIRKHGMDLDYVLNEENFPLLEKKLPDLCADRIDYSLRDASVLAEIKKAEADIYLKNLVISKNKWVFKNRRIAKKYAIFFLRMNHRYYCGLPSALMFKTVGDCLKYALNKKYLTMKDLYSTDQAVIAKIKKFTKSDLQLRILFRRMNNKIKATHLPEEVEHFVHCKSRVVDPLFLADGKIKRLSEVDQKWREILKKESSPKCYCVRFD